MNVFIASGRIAREVELKYSEAGKAYAKFSIAVTREMDRDKADFFNVTAFGKTAENCASYLVKGQEVAIVGSVQIDSNEGKYYTNVLANRVEFGNKPKGESGQAEQKQDDFGGGFDEVPF